MTISASANVPVKATAGGTNPLLTPHKMADFDLRHRLVLAPLTRCRSINMIPQPTAIPYYSERATPGALMITEGTTISPESAGYPHTPGIWTDEQIQAWKPIVNSVHDKGAVFFMQLWHCGRASHPDYQPDGKLPLSASALPITDGNQVFSLKTFKMEDYPVPHALTVDEIKTVVQEYRQAARNALDAGFDGVEIHGANGYLVDQFLKEEANTRTDEYGGSIENRCRFALEVITAVAAEVGSTRVGIRLSPFAGFLVGPDADPYASTSYLLEKLNDLNLAYVHLVEPRAGGNDDRPDGGHSLEPFRKIYTKGTFIAAGGYTAENAPAAIESGHADLIAFGRYFLSTPDFVKRVALGAPMNKYDRATFYTQGTEGYTEGYPVLEDTEWGRENPELVKQEIPVLA